MPGRAELVLKMRAWQAGAESAERAMSARRLALVDVDVAPVTARRCFGRHHRTALNALPVHVWQIEAVAGIGERQAGPAQAA